MDDIKEIRWDRKGRLICPVCRVMMRGPDPENFLNVGVGRCQDGHTFRISRESAIEINTLWDGLTQKDHGLTKDFLKNQASPDESVKEGDKGLILPPGVDR
jgi:hypothetical protein